MTSADVLAFATVVSHCIDTAPPCLHRSVAARHVGSAIADAATSAAKTSSSTHRAFTVAAEQSCRSFGNPDAVPDIYIYEESYRTTQLTWSVTSIVTYPAGTETHLVSSVGRRR